MEDIAAYISWLASSNFRVLLTDHTQKLLAEFKTILLKCGDKLKG